MEGLISLDCYTGFLFMAYLWKLPQFHLASGTNRDKKLCIQMLDLNYRTCNLIFGCKVENLLGLLLSYFLDWMELIFYKWEELLHKWRRGYFLVIVEYNLVMILFPRRLIQLSNFMEYLLWCSPWCSCPWVKYFLACYIAHDLKCKVQCSIFWDFISFHFSHLSY